VPPYNLKSVRLHSASALRRNLDDPSPEMPSEDIEDSGPNDHQAMAYRTAVILAGALLLGLTLMAAGNSP